MTRPPDIGSRTSGPLLEEVRLDGADPAFLGGLRHWVQRPLYGCTRGAVREVSIVLGELVANAFQHARPPFAVRLTLTRRGHAIRMEVDDGTAAPAVGWPVAKGLLVVRGLCPEWGVEDTALGKTVWAELPVLVPPSAR